MASLKAKRKAKKVSIPRKSKAAIVTEEKHIGAEILDWESIDPSDIKQKAYFNLRHYAYFYDPKDAFAWAKAWVKKNRPKEEYRLFSNSPERMFSMTAGSLCKMISNGYPIRESELNLINREVDAGIKRGSIKKEDKTETTFVRRSPADIVKENTSDFIGNLENWIDAFDTKDFASWSEFDLYSELLSNDLPYNTAKAIVEYYTPLYNELEELITDKPEDLKEAYSYLGIRKQKRYRAFIKNIIDEAERYMATKKATRKPRAKKTITASQQLSKLKYLKSSAEYKLTSIDPTNIIGATEVWLFNTKYRQLTRLVTSSSKGFEVKGTTIQNVDGDLSGKKMIRKPNEFFLDFTKATKAKAKKLTDGLSTKYAEANGRVNDQTLILKAYK